MPSTESSGIEPLRPVGLDRRRKERIFAAVTVTATVLVVLLLSEAGLRLLKRDVAFQPDPDLVRSLRPGRRQPVFSYETYDNLHGRSRDIPSRPQFLGYSETNDVGFRMRDPIPARKEGEVRVLLLGDSYLEGVEVSATSRFFEVSQRSLDASDPGKWRLFNGGIQNGCPSQYLLQLGRFLSMTHPDLVVVCLAPNDLTDDTLFDRLYGFECDSDGVPRSLGARAQLRALRDVWLLRYLEVFLVRYGPRVHDVIFPPFRPEVVVPDWKPVLCGNLDGLEEAYLRRTGTYLRQLRDRIEHAGAEMDVLMIQYQYVFPDELFYEPRFPTLKSELAKCGCAEDGGIAYNAFVERFLADNRIRYCNPRDALLAAKLADPSTKLWNYYDYHFSPDGNRIVGEELARFLASRPR